MRRLIWALALNDKSKVPLYNEIAQIDYVLLLESNYQGAVPCENVTLGICGQRNPRSDCADAQSDLGLRSPLTETLDTVECFDV